MPYLKVINTEYIDYDNKKYVFRTRYDKNGLTKSIQDEGLLHPILVQKTSGEKYIVIAGYRRAMSCLQLKKDRVHAFVYDEDELSEKQFFNLAIAENTKREDLEPVEIANALLKIKESFQMDLKELSEQFGEVFGIGKSVKKVENYLKLNLLDDPIKDKINHGLLKTDIGFELASIEEDKDRYEITQFVLDNDKISKNNLHQIIENAKKLKIDNEMDSFKDVFQKKVFQDVLHTDVPDRIEAFVRQLNKEVNPEKALLTETIQKKIEAIYELTSQYNGDFKGKLVIKKKSPEDSGVNITMSIKTVNDLQSMLRLFQGTGGKLLKEIIESNLQTAEVN